MTPEFRLEAPALTPAARLQMQMLEPGKRYGYVMGFTRFDQHAPAVVILTKSFGFQGAIERLQEEGRYLGHGFFTVKP